MSTVLVGISLVFGVSSVQMTPYSRMNLVTLSAIVSMNLFNTCKRGILIKSRGLSMNKLKIRTLASRTIYPTIVGKFHLSKSDIPLLLVYQRKGANIPYIIIYCLDTMLYCQACS